jgi:hypothetical protein
MEEKKEKKHGGGGGALFLYMYILVPYKTCALNTKWNSL